MTASDELHRAVVELDAAIRRMEDMEAVFPGVAMALQRITTLSLMPAKEKIATAIAILEGD